MARSEKTRKKPYGKLIIFGIVSIVMYVFLLLRQDMFNKYFTLGGIYALLPIATAFIFSFIHGNFTGSFWTVLGIEAARKKKEVR